MAQSNGQGQRPPANNNTSKKRKEAPSNPKTDSHKRTKTGHGARRRDARTLSTQTSSKAFKNGELDVDKFVKSREYEIRAMEEGMARSKKALTKRAFQQVPKELRRRTASHNVKRVPKRLQPKAKREMIDDNTPTVTARRRKPTRHMRLRMETAKQLRALGAQKKAGKTKDGDEKVAVKPESATVTKSAEIEAGIRTRAPKVKKATPATPPVPKAKFRKRQIHKTWLPTHMFHAKRARMTPPKEPLWRFAIPMTPTAKSYRPTHRAANARGAVAWDTSYMSTIGLEGQQRSIEGMFRALSLQGQGEKWQNGTRIWEGLACERQAPHKPIAPVTIIWCSPPSITDDSKAVELEKRNRSAFIRVHPSAFWQLWEEVLRLAKVAKPLVGVEDLRFEIGSIEITGPSATEALHGALWPSPDNSDPCPSQGGSVAETWNSLSGLTSAAQLPANVLLAFDVQDPRLHHPPRKANPPQNASDQDKLLELLVSWPVDSAQTAPALFDRRSRLAACSTLPSQKAINRRKSLAAPGAYPDSSPKDPRIPSMLYCPSTNMRGGQRSWTLLLPWKCVQPVWYSLMYCPLSTGGQPRFGGLDEKRQLAFETGQPWFPADFPGTKSGWEWEVDQRKKRKDEWARRPKSKRVNWEVVNLGSGKKGEVGLGWACDWERLLSGPPPPSDASKQNSDTVPSEPNAQQDDGTEKANESDIVSPPNIMHVPAAQAQQLLRSETTTNGDNSSDNALATVRLKLLTRGVPQTCARIYRLPSDSAPGNLRKKWLGLHPSNQHKQHGPKHGLPRLPDDAPAYLKQRRLAQSLLEPPKVGEDNYPACPGEEDLIGFVTTGNYNLGEGQGTGIGSILLRKVAEDVRSDEKNGRLCIVRNAGNGAGRLASWEIV